MRKIILLLFLLLLPCIASADIYSPWNTLISTEMAKPTTYQVLMDDIDKIEDKEDKLAEIIKELSKNPDIITGQALLNYKTSIQVDLKHERQGKNHCGYIAYPVYKQK